MSEKPKRRPPEYNAEQLQFIKNHIKGRYYAEVAMLFNERFGTKASRNEISLVCRANGWSNELKIHKRLSPRSYTLEQLQYLKENVAGRSYEKLTAMFNAKFGTTATIINISSVCRYYRWLNGLESGGHGGLKGKENPKYLPDGSEVVDSQGYVQVKADGVWRKKHIMLWEEAYGLVPEGHYVVFGDGDKTNLSLDNLHCIPAEQAGIWTMRKLQGATPELAQAGLALSALYAAINKRKRKKAVKGKVQTDESI